MTNPIRRQIQEHPACDTHRPRSHAEGFLRRSGREVECTPLLRVQVRIRAAQRTLGIVGVGHVGSLIREYACLWGFRVVCCDPPREEREQVSLDAIGEAEVLDALRRAQPDTMSPIEAMQLLYDLKKKLPN